MQIKKVSVICLPSREKVSAAFFQILPAWGLDPLSIVTVRGVGRSMSGRRSDSAVQGCINEDVAPESIRTSNFSAFFSGAIEIVKRGEILFELLDILQISMQPESLGSLRVAAGTLNLFPIRVQILCLSWRLPS